MKREIINLKVLKKNQLILLVVGLMLVTAGYLNYQTENNEATYTSSDTDENSYAEIGDATFVNSDSLVENENYLEEKREANEENNEIKDKIKETSNTTGEQDYFTESKLQREKMYSQMLESYQKMLDSGTVSEEQKAIAQTEIKKINDNKNAIMIAENLIGTKGFKNAVIFINDGSVSIVVEEEKLSKEQIAQIQNIISREMKADIDDIHISTK